MNLLTKRGLRTSIVLLCMSTTFLFCFPIYAEDAATLESKTVGLQNQLSGINQELVNISDEITSTEMRVEITNSEILRTQDALAVARENEAQQYEDMKSRIKYMYETGNSSLLEMLFSADNMSDFLNKADFIQNISEYDRKMLTELRDIQEGIAEQEAVLINQQDSLSELQVQLEARRTELNEMAIATSTDLAEFTAQLQQLRAEEAAKKIADAEAAQQAASQNQGNHNNNSGSAAETTPSEGEETSSDNNSTESAAGSSGENTSSGSEENNSTVVNGGSTSVTASELDVFAAILQCEAYQDYNSLLAVATVIMNRLYSPLFPNSITEIVYASGQFEPVWTGRLDSVLAAGPTSLSYQVAQDALNGARLASVSDCYYFLYAGATDRPGVNVGDNLFFQSW